jgi:hypothetical protein
VLEELRNTPEDEFNFEDEDNVLETENDTEERVEKLFLGMTAVERMFLSIFLFMNVVVLGLAFLLATQRIVF